MIIIFITSALSKLYTSFTRHGQQPGGGSLGTVVIVQLIEYCFSQIIVHIN